jgi:hypothetical protein
MTKHLNNSKREAIAQTRTREQLKAALGAILQSVFQTGLFDLRDDIIKALETNRSPLDKDFVGGLQNAILESTLIHLRALDDFFCTQPRTFYNQDDMRASDFGYHEPNAQFIDKADRKEINKRMAHLSWKRSEPFGGHRIQKHRMHALDRTIHFLDFILNAFLNPNDDERPKIEQALKQLKYARARFV